MTILEQIIEAKRQEFNVLRVTFYPSSPVCYLLAGDGGDEVFSVKLEISGGWYLDTKQKKLLVAAPDTDFAKKLELSGYFSVSGRVYELQDDDGEGGDGKVPPEGEEPWWKLSYKRTGQSFSPE